MKRKQRQIVTNSNSLNDNKNKEKWNKATKIKLSIADSNYFSMGAAQCPEYLHFVWPN